LTRPLTEREQQVYELLQRGLTDRAIAEQLYLSARTVSNHAAHIRQKLSMGRRYEMVSGAPDPLARVELLQPLTNMERAVLAQVGQGKSDADAAKVLGSTAGTIHVHLGHIYDKLPRYQGMSPRSVAIIYARQEGLV
jgi:DNA-binding NarL/FixJ family response regulator